MRRFVLGDFVLSAEHSLVTFIAGNLSVSELQGNLSVDGLLTLLSQLVFGDILNPSVGHSQEISCNGAHRGEEDSVRNEVQLLNTVEEPCNRSGSVR